MVLMEFMIILTSLTFPFPIGLILYPFLTILLVVLSKIILKKGFSEPHWLGSFIIVMILSAAGLLMYLVTSDIITLLGHLEADDVMGFFLTFVFGGFSFAYFIAYLINFIIRLVRHIRLKKKENTASE